MAVEIQQPDALLPREPFRPLTLHATIKPQNETISQKNNNKNRIVLFGQQQIQRWVNTDEKSQRNVQTDSTDSNASA